MQVFWDISPTIFNPALGIPMPKEEKRAQSQASFLLTQNKNGQDPLSNIPSDPTREAIMSWASEEKGVGRYVGLCRVIDLCGGDQWIRPQDLKAHLFGKVTRILIRTKNFEGRKRLLTPEAIELMASCGVKLIGIDAEGLDAPDCPIMRGYKTAAKFGISVLVNLNLETVIAGN